MASGAIDRAALETMVFMLSALLAAGQLLVLFDRIVLRVLAGWRGNPFLLAVLVGTFALQLILIYWAPAQSILSTEPLAAGDLAVVLVASTSLFWIVEAKKLVRRFRERGRPMSTSEPGPPTIIDGDAT